jgi:phage gp29-like protein
VRDDYWYGGGFEDRGLALDSVPHKFVTFTPQLFNEYPEREGFGSRALFFALFKRLSWRWRMILLEIFGMPWRIIELDPEARVDPETLEKAQQTADELGSTTSAAFSPGVRFRLESPSADSVAAHDLTAEKCDDQISKLVLGQTRTTDAAGDGLGGGQAYVHQDGETLVITADGWGVSEALTYGVARDWVALNYGVDESINAPRIDVAYESPPDQTEELDRTEKALALGVPLKLDEVYAKSGFSRPSAGDEVVTRDAAPASPFGGGGGDSARVSQLGEPTEEGDAVAPLARAAARSLRLSRLSRIDFSGRS